MLDALEKQRFVLEKMGQAIYTHKKNIERAKKAQQSVEYLSRKGVLS